MSGVLRDGELCGVQPTSGRGTDGRREVGMIARDPKVVKRMQEAFEADWAKTDLGRKEQKQYQKELKQAESEEIVLEIPHT